MFGEFACTYLGVGCAKLRKDRVSIDRHAYIETVQGSCRVVLHFEQLLLTATKIMPCTILCYKVNMNI